MTYLTCPRCRLSIRTRVADLTMEHCPRCIARLGLSMRLQRSPRPARFAAAGPATAAPVRA
jgi:Zn-finger nucleic acid-binding protein